MGIGSLARSLSGTYIDPRRLLKGSRLTIDLSNGLQFKLLFDVRQLVTRVVRNRGVFEQWLTDFFVGNVKPGQVAIDVGANVGYFSLLFALLTKPGGRVIAVEPLYTTDVHANLALNRSILTGSSVSVVKAALADRPGSRLIYQPRDRDLASSSLTSRTHREQQSMIRCLTLDQIAADLDRLDWVKMDVEGAEGLVLDGGLETISRFRPNLVLAWSPELMKRLGTAEDALRSLLLQYDYQLFCSEEGMKELRLPTTEGYEHTVVAVADAESIELPSWR